MKVNTDVLNAIQGPLADVCEALLAGKVVEELCPSDGWVETEQVNPSLSRDDYRIIDRKRVMARLRSPNNS